MKMRVHSTMKTRNERPKLKCSGTVVGVQVGRAVERPLAKVPQPCSMRFML